MRNDQGQLAGGSGFRSGLTQSDLNSCHGAGREVGQDEGGLMAAQADGVASWAPGPFGACPSGRARWLWGTSTVRHDDMVLGGTQTGWQTAQSSSEGVTPRPLLRQFS